MGDPRVGTPFTAGGTARRNAGDVRLRRSSSPLTVLGVVLGIVAAVTLASIVAIFLVLENEQSREADVVISNRPWSAFQLHSEANLTLRALTDALSKDVIAADDLDRVRLRADIFISRFPVYLEARRSQAMPYDAELDGVVASLQKDAERDVAQLDALATGDRTRDVLLVLRDSLAGMVPKLANVLGRVHQADIQRRWEEREAIHELHRMLATAVGGLALSMLGLMVLLIRQMRRVIRTQARMEAVERENLAASLALVQRDEQAASLRREAELAETVNTFNGKVNDSVTRLAAMIEDITERCTAMTKAVEQARGGSETASQASSRAAEHVLSLARTADAMSSAARDMATKSAETSLTAIDATGEADRTGQAIHELSSAVAHIGSITRLIASIAGRTNLLALNATIEAARAGESGRGFAVVAAEVKSLALQTSDATADITRQIQAIQDAAASCMHAMDGIRARIASLGTTGEQIGAIIDTQSRSVEQVASMMRDVTHETVAVSSTSRSVAQAAEHANAAAGAVLHLMVEVNEEGRRIRRDIEQFRRSLAEAQGSRAQAS
ncbi:methyl-accepting chemotaxis protein [Alsobacter sp. R-9]